ncbi:MULTISPECIES: RNA polymerase sigma factor [Methylosinus]|uniref:Sigma-70 family RNA polymerase sigma factor n=1 Tax=Methylosinus trichosporium (strain ATCC 35070 / NCIMB 11131 / UNIQEM 75 / OB3b) TaxID=595536 RepID=A0A2D2D7K6_METT3|nr:sigma-70 family RNA polymerase sigma factor [Methylosinus trichosporium OB3b]
MCEPTGDSTGEAATDGRFLGAVSSARPGSLGLMLGSLNRVFQVQRGSLMWSVMRIVRDAQIAEDLVHDAYLRVRRAMEAGPIEHVEAFLHQTARNLALDYRRRRRMRGAVELEAADDDALLDIADNALSQETAIIEREKFVAFRSALSGLPPRAQQVMILSRIEEWPNRRIAEHLGISERTVFNDLKTAMAHCRERIARLDP